MSFAEEPIGNGSGVRPMSSRFVATAVVLGYARSFLEMPALSSYSGVHFWQCQWCRGYAGRFAYTVHVGSWVYWVLVRQGQWAARVCRAVFRAVFRQIPAVSWAIRGAFDDVNGLLAMPSTLLAMSALWPCGVLIRQGQWSSRLCRVVLWQLPAVSWACLGIFDNVRGLYLCRAVFWHMSAVTWAIQCALTMSVVSWLCLVVFWQVPVVSWVILGTSDDVHGLLAVPG
jgi:hypothetical protein